MMTYAEESKLNKNINKIILEKEKIEKEFKHSGIAIVLTTKDDPRIRVGCIFNIYLHYDGFYRSTLVDLTSGTEVYKIPNECMSSCPTKQFHIFVSQQKDLNLKASNELQSWCVHCSDKCPWKKVQNFKQSR